MQREIQVYLYHEKLYARKLVFVNSILQEFLYFYSRKLNMFKENVRSRMEELGMTAKDVANAMESTGNIFKTKEPHRTVESWIGKKAYIPSALSAYAIAIALKTSIEALVDGEAGEEYIRKIVRNDPRAIQVPDRIRPIVENMLLLDDDNLVGIRANVEALVKKRAALEANALPG